jgi:hypothetical protein
MHYLGWPELPDWLVAERARKRALGDPSWADPLPDGEPVSAGAWLYAVGSFCRKYKHDLTLAMIAGVPKERIMIEAVTEFERLNHWQLDAMRAPPRTPADELAEHEAMYFDVVA